MAPLATCSQALTGSKDLVCCTRYFFTSCVARLALPLSPMMRCTHTTTTSLEGPFLGVQDLTQSLADDKCPWPLVTALTL
jgi:hypothetical protein